MFRLIKKRVISKIRACRIVIEKLYCAFRAQCSSKILVFLSGRGICRHCFIGCVYVPDHKECVEQYLCTLNIFASLICIFNARFYSFHEIYVYNSRGFCHNFS